MSITLDEVRHVARLARLQLDENELVAFQGELNALLGHFRDLEWVDVAGFMSKPHAMALYNVWADDEAAPGLDRRFALQNSKVTKGGLFIVPTIIEE